jgi:hypothetical protein
LNPPCGGSRGIDGCQRFLLARSVASGVGGTRPPRLSPGGETGKGEIRLPCCRRRFALAWRWQARRWLSVCARSTTFLSVTITNLLCRSARSAFQKSCRRHPLLCRASIRTLHGPAMGPVQVGSDLRPRSITTVTDLGCWVLPSCGRSLKDQSYQTQSPEQGGGCLYLPKLLDVCRPPRPSTHVGSAPHLVSLRLLGMVCPGDGFACFLLGRLRSLPHFRCRRAIA